MEEYKILIAGQDVIVTRWGVNDYDAYFTEDDFSVRGTFSEVLENIMSKEEDAWLRGLIEKIMAERR